MKIKNVSNCSSITLQECKSYLITTKSELDLYCLAVYSILTYKHNLVPVATEIFESESRLVKKYICRLLIHQLQDILFCFKCHVETLRLDVTVSGI